jgi:hypothetical protein
METVKLNIHLEPEWHSFTTIQWTRPWIDSFVWNEVHSSPLLVLGCKMASPLFEAYKSHFCTFSWEFRDYPNLIDCDQQSVSYRYISQYMFCKTTSQKKYIKVKPSYLTERKDVHQRWVKRRDLSHNLLLACFTILIHGISDHTGQVITKVSPS